MSNYHVSVLLEEVISYLLVKPGEKYIDGTLGGGGHSFEILKRGGNVLGLDVDQDAIAYVQEQVKSQKPKIKIGEELTVVRGNFKDIDRIAKENDFGQVAGIVLDLGVSSHQFDAAERGFSFQADGPLDMRMDQGLAVSAKDLVNALSKGELYELFTKFGEERFSHAITNAIISARRVKPIERTKELEQIIRRAVHFKTGDVHPATRVFQALRIAINDELFVLKDALPKAVSLLQANGRIAVITFHSLEDRIVKETFNTLDDKGIGKVITKKPVIPTDEEIGKNKRSRSAKLRVFEKQ